MRKTINIMIKLLCNLFITLCNFLVSCLDKVQTLDMFEKAINIGVVVQGVAKVILPSQHDVGVSVNSTESTLYDFFFSTGQDSLVEILERHEKSVEDILFHLWGKCRVEQLPATRYVFT